jgi:hypothetical protein
MPDLLHNPGSYTSDVVDAGETESTLYFWVQPGEVRA